MEYHSILFEARDGIAAITLNTPQNLNALNDAMYDELLAALDDCGRDPGIRCVVLNSSGRAFCGGGDIGEMAAKLREEGDVGFRTAAPKAAGLSLAIMRLPKPVIASVSGAVAGAAFNLVLACDLCIASERAKFIQAFVKIGLIPDAGGLFLLTRSLGASRAAQLAMTGDVVGAREAQALGIVYRVCADEALAEETRALAARFSAGPALAYARMKELMLESFFSGYAPYAEKEAACQVALGASADFREGITAFLEKRDPVFTGT